MRKSENKTQIEGLLVLVLFGVFAICILSVLLTGAGAYGRLVDRQQASYEERTVPQYIATKVRQSDVSDGVTIGDFCGVEALELMELPGKEYVTRIYCYDGYLRELFSTVTGSFEPDAGEKILEAQQVDFILNENCLSVFVTGTDGEKTEVKLTLRSKRRGGR